MATFREFINSPSGRNLSKVIFFTLLISVGLGLGSVLALTWYAATGLPSLANLHEYQPSLITRVHADNGQVFGQFYVERRILTPLTEAPQHLLDAIVAVEDSRFFEHPGLDFWGILRATWTNLKRGGKVEGASTITQQLARSLFLSPERTFQRKIRELILALKMEFILSKKQILEMYLNQIYFGHGAYGVGTAALTYFGKGLSEITLPEGAFLAGLPKAPTTYSPYNNRKLSKKRQEHVLGRMVQANYISATEAQKAVDTPLSFQRRSIERIAPYFLEDVRQHLVRQYGESMVYKGGIQIFTTLNIEMQKIAERAVKAGLRRLDKRQGWRGPLRHEEPPMMLPEQLPDQLPARGEIVEGVVVTVTKDEAMVLADNALGTLPLKSMIWAKRRLAKGMPVIEAKELPITSAKQLLRPGDVIEVRLTRKSRGKIRWALEQTPLVEGAFIALDPRTGAIRAMVGGYNFERSQFNRAVHSLRQPGSAFKPIIYATALNEGMTPSSLVLDAPVVYEQEDPLKTWKPENYEKRFFGPITLREALRHSRNAATVRLLDQLGVRKITEFSRNLGIRSPLSQDLSLALGSSGITLEEITSAYGIFANQGIGLRPYMISIVKDIDNKTLEQHLFEPRQVIPKETAYLITHMLMDVIQSGTGRKARKIGRPLAGKTGTTNSYNDAWFVGFAPNLAAGVWVGFDGVATLGKVESGAHAALPIWTAFMAKALRSLPVRTFTIPEGIQFAEVDSGTGMVVSEPTQHTSTEVFAEGTIPRMPTRSIADPLEFYELDQRGPEIISPSDVNPLPDLY